MDRYLRRIYLKMCTNRINEYSPIDIRFDYDT